jgi:hypothetical protein
MNWGQFFIWWTSLVIIALYVWPVVGPIVLYLLKSLLSNQITSYLFVSSDPPEKKCCECSEIKT